MLLSVFIFENTLVCLGQFLCWQRHWAVRCRTARHRPLWNLRQNQQRMILYETNRRRT
ncbi:hypothetical protein AtDm6_2695 [Acetobacter tropicalis]|uniref:Uncharacterized protein n=1 Tax=Acetobacter tropicalis TaxID=104102 RepID=A0A094YMT1_9PROT|nr:hypothetical protein AtDm6_2695 [Acetobacter tropicalis]